MTRVGTGTREKRTMTSTRAKPIHRDHAAVHARAIERRRDVRYDPAGLGATLRDLASRAHCAVRAIDAASGPRSDAAQAAESLQELAELHPQIVQLQQCVDAESQQGPASYVSALRRAVEERLC